MCRQAMGRASRDRIDLWLAFIDEQIDDGLLLQYKKLLAPDELLRHSRFHFERDRHLYLVTRALVRTTLSRYSALKPQQWTFELNGFGRPEITNADGDARDIAFNISHTAGAVLLAVTSNVQIGVDIESLAARQPSLNIADAFFAPEEVVALRTRPNTQQNQRFFEYWTLKESYIKARSKGLAIPLDQFSFDFPTDKTIRLAFKAQLRDEPSRWRFWQFRFGAQYLAAICAERFDNVVPQLILRQIVPMRKEGPCDYELVATTEG
jgi:4'-phosphopantetheinyl transferase